MYGRQYTEFHYLRKGRAAAEVISRMKDRKVAAKDESNNYPSCIPTIEGLELWKVVYNC